MMSTLVVWLHPAINDLLHNNFMTTFATTLATSSTTGTLVLLLGISVLLLLFWYCATDKLKRKRNIGTAIVLIIAFSSIFAIISPAGIVDWATGKKSFAEACKLEGGIDLTGGTSVILEVIENEDENGHKIPLDPAALRSLQDKLSERLNKDGGLDVPITIIGSNRIEIQIPNIEPARAKKLIKKISTAAKLTMHEVHPKGIGTQLAEDVYFKKKIESGYRAYPEYVKDENGKIIPEQTKYYLVKRKPGLTGADIEHAWSSPTELGVVNIQLSSKGGDAMRAFTNSLKVGDLLVTVLDGKVVNTASLRTQTLGRNFQISGLGSLEECKQLAESLLNPLENDLRVLKQQSVSATLGASTITQGINAGIVGLALTLLFVLIYYRFAGVIALFGLLFNMIILFGAMAAFGASFTLPGIAGIILTIGVAVDANVLIYERMREELAMGKSVKMAIKVAYEKAFSAIIDANITTLITACILFWMASGSIRGFATTLIIGILGTLLASLLCTRVLFWWADSTGILKKLNFMNLIPERTFDFLSTRKITFLLSGILILGGIGTIITKGGSNLGVDFTGGNILRFEIPEGKNITQEEVENALKDLKLEKAHSSQIEHPSNLGLSSSKSFITVKCGERAPDSKATGPTDKDLIIKTIKSHFSITKTPTEEKVSATLGSEFLRKAIWALALGLFGVLIYITVRFEFSFAIGAFAALIHDVLITLGLLYILGEELSMIHISAFLTLVGYSINDTIVVFDRIREKLKTKRGDVKEIMNSAISDTLSRTVLTSLTTFVAVLVLYIYGGSALSAFSLTIMIGVVVGTYSSIFIASPIVYIISKYRGANLRRELLDADLEAQITPGIEVEPKSIRNIEA